MIEELGGIEAIEAYLYKLSDKLIEGMAELGYAIVAPKARACRSPHNTVFVMMNPAWAPFL